MYLRPTSLPLLRLGVALALLACLLPACSSDSPTGTPPGDDGPAQLSVSPATGSPGTLFAISGLALDRVDPAALTLRLGGMPGAVALSPSGQLLGVVPLLAAGADGQSPPAAAQALELFAGDERVGRAKAAFTVQALAPAPGATAALAQAFTGISGELARIADLLAPEPGVEAQWLLALAGGLDELVGGEDPRSLAGALATLSAEDPAALALLDAYLAGSGLLAQTEDLLAALEALEIPDTRDAADTEDIVLARKMQFYVLAKLFGQTVVHGTAEGYAYTAGLLTGAIGVSVNLPPPVAIVSAVIAVADFAVNKILLGLLPASISEFALTLEDTALAMGETTDAELTLTAVNEPPGVGIQDIVSLTLTLLGLVPNTPQIHSVEAVLTSAAAFFTGAVQQVMASYSDAHPELGLDVSVALVPALSWTTTIEDPRLVDCLSYSPTIIDGAPEAVNWQAGTSQAGSAEIFARTATDSDALLLALLPGFSYQGGAFGEQVTQTAPVAVSVSGDLQLSLDFPPFIAPGAFEPLTVWASYAVAGGDPQPAAGVHIEVVADGGTVSPTSGTTNGAGQFITIASLAEGAAGLVVTVTASDAGGAQATASASAASTANGVQLLGNASTLSVNADAMFFGGEDCSDYSSYAAEWDDFDDTSQSLTAACSSSEPACGGALEASASGSLQLQFLRDPLSGRLLGIRAEGSVTAVLSGTTGSCGGGGGAGAISTPHIEFLLDRSLPVRVSGTVACGEASRVTIVAGDFEYDSLTSPPGSFNEMEDLGSGGQLLRIYASGGTASYSVLIEFDPQN